MFKPVDGIPDHSRDARGNDVPPPPQASVTAIETGVTQPTRVAPAKDRVGTTEKNIRVDPSILSGLITTGERNSHYEL